MLVCVEAAGLLAVALVAAGWEGRLMGNWESKWFMGSPDRIVAELAVAVTERL